MTVYTLTVLSKNGKDTIKAEKGKCLADVLCENGYTVSAACGRLGVCSKCSVRVLEGSFDGVTPDENGTVKSCKALVSSDAVIYADFEKNGGLTDFSPEISNRQNATGIAVDIGTTTVAAALLKSDGSVISISRLNPQSAYGADVISRIEACSGGKTEVLTSLIRQCINSMIDELCPGNPPPELIISGNTTMLHLFCGISPEAMGVYPFTPAFTSVQRPDGDEIGMRIKKITVLPSVSAFVGSDIVSGIYSLSLHKESGCTFFADLGTNGELVMTSNGNIYCTSTAAGPALEGACMECGTGGIPGAIDRVKDENGKISFTTIENKEPCGICGAGIADAVKVMLSREIIDETGAMDDERYFIADGIYISQADIRQFQLAKSAIYSGIETLIAYVNGSVSDIGRFYLAGGLGYYLDSESAVRDGILPKMTCPVIAAGNTSLAGALMCIGNEEAVREMSQTAERCISVDLGGEPAFNERFMEHMFFD